MLYHFPYQVFPPEILELKKLVSLKLRDNPIKEIPQGKLMFGVLSRRNVNC